MSGVIKCLYGTDLHKRATDITTIKGYANCTKAVQRNIMKLIADEGISYFFEGGDWYDKGYASDVAVALADTDLDVIMNSMLNGNFYGVIGNHIKLNMDSNPELHLIQPHQRYKSRAFIDRTEQIIKTPEYVRIRDVQISLVHYRYEVTDVLDYAPIRQPWAKYHIAMFHTPMIIPFSMLSKTNMGYSATPSAKIEQALRGVDVAICGDIHMPLGQFSVGDSCTMIVPGSLTNTDSGELGRHTDILLPMFSIYEDSTVEWSYKEFNLLTNTLTFSPKKDAIAKKKLKTLRGNAVENLHEESTESGIVNSSAAYMSLNAFMAQQNWSSTDKELFKLVLDNPNDIGTCMKLYAANKLDNIGGV